MPAGRQNTAHPVDVYVGSRLRERRMTLGMSQPKLAAALGISYQQLYKHERAKNRIGASRLYELSKVLGVPVTFFFEGIGGCDGAEAEARDGEPAAMTDRTRLPRGNPPQEPVRNEPGARIQRD
jgi:transcriptional regulator with XRE-family HTH domain